MIFAWIFSAIISIFAFIANLIFVPIQAAMALIPLPAVSVLSTILGWVDWFFPPGFFIPYLTVVIIYYLISLVLWIVKKVNDLPLVP